MCRNCGANGRFLAVNGKTAGKRACFALMPYAYTGGAYVTHLLKSVKRIAHIREYIYGIKNVKCLTVLGLHAQQLMMQWRLLTPLQICSTIVDGV